MNPVERARARPGAPFTITFDGREIEALPGRTVAAALWAAGVFSWRSTRGAGRPRGVFCGIGVCFDCLVTVDGRPNLRACLVPAEPGADVRTQEGTGHDG
ncbi:(2Fe-2S)-binding protein [Streptomyces sp. NPDC059582]|uniref:(2Fe-2S)-binding protein n=1 Tax=Streptomyces sp. NPDC059582 TaxID=3346875 RepID=UPI0036B686FE